MSHEVIKHLLDDYVMGDLDDEARAPVAEHVAACDTCRAEVKSLEEIKARAAALPREIEPPADAWSNIRATIERDREAVARSTSARAGFWQRPTGIAAAVLLAAITSSAGTYWYLRDRSASVPELAAVSEGTPATLAAFTVEENNYLRTAAALQDLLDQQENAMSPETVAQLKTSLRTIDAAILEARNALARDPANRMLIQMLSVTYRQKVDLLRRTTELTRGS